MTLEEFPDKADEKKGTPMRLRLGMRALASMCVSNIKTEGLEHLEEIPSTANVIIACSHISDFDMPIVAAALGDKFNLAISDQSVHRTSWQELPTYLGELALGHKNFLPIDYSFDNDGKKYGRFNPANFTTMQEATQEGKTVLIAAHNPSDGVLPSRPGVGASYIALGINNAVILPVAVDIQYKNPQNKNTIRGQIQAIFERPEAIVKIGTPIAVEKNEELEKDMLTKDIIKNVRSVSEEIMSAIAHMLPIEKRQSSQTP